MTKWINKLTLFFLHIYLLLLWRKRKIIQLSLQPKYQLETEMFRPYHVWHILVGAHSVRVDSTGIKRQPITDKPSGDQGDAPKSFTHRLHHSKVKTTCWWDQPLHSTMGMHEMRIWNEAILTSYVNTKHRGLQNQTRLPSSIHNTNSTKVTGQLLFHICA